VSATHHLVVIPRIQAPTSMVQELSYNSLSNVIESWEQLRRIKNYEQIAGVKLFQKYVLGTLSIGV
jgi:hypothetical protein